MVWCTARSVGFKEPTGSRREWIDGHLIAQDLTLCRVAGGGARRLHVPPSGESVVRGRHKSRRQIVSFGHNSPTSEALGAPARILPNGGRSGHQGKEGPIDI